MNEDKRLHAIIDSGKELSLSDLHFHTHWIDVNTSITPNPVNNILFRRLVEEIEELVEKKREIFQLVSEAVS